MYDTLQLPEQIQVLSISVQTKIYFCTAYNTIVYLFFKCTMYTLLYYMSFLILKAKLFYNSLFVKDQFISYLDNLKMPMELTVKQLTKGFLKQSFAIIRVGQSITTIQLDLFFNLGMLELAYRVQTFSDIIPLAVRYLLKSNATL